MEIDITYLWEKASTKYLSKQEKIPPHQLAAVVNLFKEFLGEFKEPYNYGYWLRKAKNCTYAEALTIIKDLETLPVQYNKAGAIINKLKKLHAK